MGTMIHLSVGRLTVAWGKNDYFDDHGHLFQESDFGPVATYYAGKNWPKGKDIVEFEDGFAKPLALVRDRLELLGHTRRAAEQRYEAHRRRQEAEFRPPPFRQVISALNNVKLAKITGKYRENYELGQLIGERTLRKLALQSEAHHYYQPGLRPDHWEVDLLLEQFNPYDSLRLLADTTKAPLSVTWDFSPLVEAGWATRDHFKAGARSQQQFLVVTEGSSDAAIIRKALQLYRPHLADFFKFVDMEEGYPFSGTGNLHKFTQGLTSIGIQNNTVVVYDNDAEGVSKMNESTRLPLTNNMRVMKLPHHKDFNSFRTVGPHGTKTANINGRAASIECYLDLRRRRLPRPLVRWTSFNRKLGVYQGELEQKARYMKDFVKMKNPDATYARHRIIAVLDALIAQCVSIAEAKQIESIQ